MYHAEQEHSADTNRDIQPDEDITDQMTAFATTPVSESDTTCGAEIYKFHTKLAQMAEHLADITTSTLRQHKFTEDVEFSCLIRDCGDELAAMGEFLIEVANTISENVSVEMPKVIDISDSEDDKPVTNEISNTVQDSVKRKMTSAKRSVPSQPVQDSAERSMEKCHDGATGTLPSVQDSATNVVKLPSVQVSAKNKKHVLDTVSANPKVLQTLPSGKKLSVYVCELYGKHIKMMPRLFDHLDNHATNPYKCAECGKIYYSLYILN